MGSRQSRLYWVEQQANCTPSQYLRRNGEKSPLSYLSESGCQKPNRTYCDNPSTSRGHRTDSAPRPAAGSSSLKRRAHAAGSSSQTAIFRCSRGTPIALSPGPARCAGAVVQSWQMVSQGGFVAYYRVSIRECSHLLKQELARRSFNHCGRSANRTSTVGW